jgi:hypothetical protein
VFLRMQKQLNSCIRHHQQILRCVTQNVWLRMLSQYNS